MVGQSSLKLSCSGPEKGLISGASDNVVHLVGKVIDSIHRPFDVSVMSTSIVMKCFGVEERGA